MGYSEEISSRLRRIIELLNEIDALGQKTTHHRIDRLDLLSRKLSVILDAMENQHIGKATQLVQQLLGCLAGEPIADISRSDIARALGKYSSELKATKARENGRYYGGRPRKDGRPSKRKYRCPTPAKTH